MRGPLTPFPRAPATGGLGMEIGGAFGDPREKGRKPWMAAQGVDAVVAAGQFGLGQGSVNLIVANLMEQHDRPALAAAQFRRQVMKALLGIRRDRAVAKRADGQIAHVAQGWCPRGARQGAMDG